jgi:hypothetical protein
VALSHGISVLKNMLCVLEYLKVHPCIDCGEANPLVLEFDHRSEKNFTIGDSLTRAIISPDILLNEMELCDVRCANCHRKRHHGNSYRALEIEELKKIIAAKNTLGLPPKSNKALTHKRRGFIFNHFSNGNLVKGVS